MCTVTTDPGPLSVADFGADPGRLRKERAARCLLAGAALTSVVNSIAIVLSLIGEAWTFVSQVEWKTLWTDGWFPRRGMYDVKTIVSGSLLVTVIAMAVAAPLGLGDRKSTRLNSSH